MSAMLIMDMNVVDNGLMPVELSLMGMIAVHMFLRLGYVTVTGVIVIVGMGMSMGMYMVTMMRMSMRKCFRSQRVCTDGVQKYAALAPH